MATIKKIKQTIQWAEKWAEDMNRHFTEKMYVAKLIEEVISFSNQKNTDEGSNDILYTLAYAK